jgi:hypothetical protein
VCDCNLDEDYCAHVYAALISSATHRVNSEESNEVVGERPVKCRYCGSPDISKAGFRYNARGISRRYICNARALQDNPPRSIEAVPLCCSGLLLGV